MVLTCIVLVGCSQDGPCYGAPQRHDLVDADREPAMVEQASGTGEQSLMVQLDRLTSMMSGVPSNQATACATDSSVDRPCFEG